jgi:hypothetical protein
VGATKGHMVHVGIGKSLVLVAVLGAFASACLVLPVGDLGAAFFQVPLILEDPIDGAESAIVAAAWSTPSGPHFAVCSKEPSPQGAPTETLVVYEAPPGSALQDGVARLDFYFGLADDIIEVAHGRVATGAVATSRSTAWQADRDLKTLDASAVPFALSDVPSPSYAPNDFLTGVVFVDSSDANARRCGDLAANECSVDCDVITGVGAAACCQQAHDNFMRCDALLLDSFYGSVPVRLRNLGPP